jgi:hypothetical protein
MVTFELLGRWPGKKSCCRRLREKFAIRQGMPEASSGLAMRGPDEGRRETPILIRRRVERTYCRTVKAAIPAPEIGP